MALIQTVLVHLLVLKVLISVASGFEKKVCYESSVQHFEDWRFNERMDGHTFLTYSPSSDTFCVKKCKQYKECRSVNFNRETLVCELNDVNYTTHPGDLRINSTFRYKQYSSDVNICGNETCPTPGRCAALGDGKYKCLLECPSGTRMVGNSCVCPVGKYSNESDHYGYHNCIDCPGGYYQDKEGQDECKNCTAGQYQDEVGQIECKACPTGHYTDVNAQSTCTPCSAGYYQASTGALSCSACPAGRYQSSTGQSSCINCPTGKRQPSTGQSSCINCSPGTYQNSQGQTSCRNCPAGRYQNSGGQSSCKLCPAGKYQSGTGATSCNNCPSGTYNPYTGRSSCLSCSTSTSSGATTC